MAKKETIFKNVNELIKLLDQAITEREGGLRALCGSCCVSNYNDIEDLELWRMASELDHQIYILNDLRNEAKSAISEIGAFKDIV